MDSISRITAALKTYVRGISLPEEKPLFTVTPMMVVSATALTLVVDLAATQLIWSSQKAWLCPLYVPLFALGQAAIWYLYMEQHQASHGAISGTRWHNRLVAEIASLVCLSQPPSRYDPKHLREHHPWKLLATIADPDFRWLKRLGFIEGQSLEDYWALLWRTLLSPAFYGRNLASRARAQMAHGTFARRCLVIFWWALLISAAAAFQLWAALAMYLLLLSLGYPLSALLQTLTEHRWASTEAPRLRTHPRLLPIDENPNLFLVYLYWRMAILSTDLQQHQAHHYKPVNLEWPMVAYSQDAREDLPRAEWGIRNHFLASFESLAQASPSK